VCNTTTYKPRTLPSFFRCGTHVYDILPHPILWRPCHRWAPCLSCPLEYLAIYQSHAWVGSDSTCHGTITFSPKGRSNGVYSSTAYKPRTLPSLCRCKTLFYDICHGAIILFLKGRSDGVCSATAYKLRTLQSIFRCGTCLWHSAHPILWCPHHRWVTLRTPYVKVLGKSSKSDLGWLWYHLSQGYYSLPKRPIWWGM